MSVIVDEVVFNCIFERVGPNIDLDGESTFRCEYSLILAIWLFATPISFLMLPMSSLPKLPLAFLWLEGGFCLAFAEE